MFPTSITGEIRVDVPPALRSTVLDGILNEVRQVAVPGARRVSDVVQFSGSASWIGPTGDWGPLSGVGQSAIEVIADSALRVRYRFSVSMWMAKVLAMVMTMAVVSLATFRSWMVLQPFPLILLWMVGGLYLMLWARLHAFVRRASTVRGVGSEQCPHCGQLYRADDYEETAPIKVCEACGGEL